MTNTPDGGPIKDSGAAFALLTQSTLAELPDWLDNARQTGAAALIDKEVGWTSFDVVGKLRNCTRIKKVGHAGTLDPLATGLLILCFGKATKSLQHFQAQNKRYEAIIKLGATTQTYDAEGAEENVCDVQHITPDMISEAISAFEGAIDQAPPMFSAVKKNGVPLYKLARKGQTVERATRRVFIDSIKVRSYETPLLSLSIQCSKGVYIRTLAHDIGAKLGTGAYLSALRRTGIGSYSVDDAPTVHQVVDAVRNTSAPDIDHQLNDPVAT